METVFHRNAVLIKAFTKPRNPVVEPPPRRELAMEVTENAASSAKQAEITVVSAISLAPP